jgi:integrase
MPRTPRPRYRADRDCWFAQVDGRRVILARGKGSLAEAKAALLQRLAELPRIKDAEPDRLVGEILERRLDWLIRNRSARTVEGDRWYLNALASAFGRMRVSDLKPHHVHSWLARQPSWGPGTQRRVITLLKAAFAWADDMRLVPHHPLRTLKRPPSAARPRCTGQEDVARILPWIRSEEFRDYLIVLSETGARPSEISRLEARHLRGDLQAAVLEAHKTAHKVGTPRVVYFTERAWDLVTERARRLPDGLLFRTEQGRPWSDSARNTQIRRILKRAGGKLPRFTSYSFRHGFTTDALERGLTSSEVAALVGNSSQMIDRTYDHLRNRQPAMRAALERAKPPTGEG